MGNRYTVFAVTSLPLSQDLLISALIPTISPFFPFFFLSTKATQQEKVTTRLHRLTSFSPAEEPRWTEEEGCGSRTGNKGQLGSAVAALGSTYSAAGNTRRHRMMPAVEERSRCTERVAVEGSNSKSRRRRRRKEGMAGEGSRLWWEMAAAERVAEEREQPGRRGCI